MEENESIDYAELFGVEEVNAGPADEETGEAGSEQDTTQPDEDEEIQEDGSAIDAAEDEAQTQQQRQKDDPQLNAREQQAAIDRAVQAAIEKNNQQHQSELAAFFQKANLKNTITGEPITDMEGFDKWNSAFSNAKLEQDLKAGRLTPEMLQAVIAQNPLIQQAQQMLAQQTAEKQQAQMQVQAQQAKAILDEEITKISQQDPSVRTVEDLMESENYDQIYGLVQKGYALSDAFKLVNFDRLTQRVAAASRQQARNQELGKRHMIKTQARGAGAVEVPREIKQAYLELMPNATDTEIREHWAKYIKH